MIVNLEDFEFAALQKADNYRAALLAAKQVRFFDRCIFPLQHRFEARILRPPIGMSLLAVAAATKSSPTKASRFINKNGSVK